MGRHYSSLIRQSYEYDITFRQKYQIQWTVEKRWKRRAICSVSWEYARWAYTGASIFFVCFVLQKRICQGTCIARASEVRGSYMYVNAWLGQYRHLESRLKYYSQNYTANHKVPSNRVHRVLWWWPSCVTFSIPCCV